MKVNTTNINPEDSYALAIAIAQEASNRKGSNIVLLRVAEVSYIADYFIMVTGFSKVQVRSMSQAIASQVEISCQRLPLRIEGQLESSWVLLDYGDVIAHIMLPSEREFYNLEAFWGHGDRIDLSFLEMSSPNVMVGTNGSLATRLH